MYVSRGAMGGPMGVSEGFSDDGSTVSQTTRPSYFAVSSMDSVYNTNSAYRTPPFLPPGANSIYQSGLYNFPVVRIRGLPFNCDDMDIYKFFTGLDIVDCVFVNKNGRFTGDAFVVFPTPIQAQFAMQRDRQMMGHRYVEVFACKKSDYYNTIAAEVNFGGFGSYNSDRSPPPLPLPRAKRPRSAPRDEPKNIDEMHFTEILKLRGLPYSVTKSDITEFFGREFRLDEGKVEIVSRFDGKATGEAFVEFGSADEAKRAMGKDKMVLGSRYVELFPSCREEAGRAKSGRGR